MKLSSVSRVILILFVIAVTNSNTQAQGRSAPRFTQRRLLNLSGNTVGHRRLLNLSGNTVGHRRLLNLSGNTVGHRRLLNLSGNSVGHRRLLNLSGNTVGHRRLLNLSGNTVGHRRLLNLSGNTVGHRRLLNLSGNTVGHRRLLTLSGNSVGHRRLLNLSGNSVGHRRLLNLGGNAVEPTEVPESLLVKPGHKLHKVLRACGFQEFAFENGKWTMYNASATLSTFAGKEVGVHYFLPKKTGLDGQPNWKSLAPEGLCTGAVSIKVTVSQDTIPWLLLKATDTSGSSSEFGEKLGAETLY